ncbi:hypothetical protein VaNZ11_013304, partial [Volvox africanus]
NYTMEGYRFEGVCASFESDYSPEGLQCLTNDDCAVPPVPFNNTLLDSCNDILPCTVLLDTDLAGEVKGQRVAWRRRPLEVIYGRRERLRINTSCYFSIYLLCAVVVSCCRADDETMRCVLHGPCWAEGAWKVRRHAGLPPRPRSRRQ